MNSNPSMTTNTHFMYTAIIFAVFIFMLPMFSPKVSETTLQSGKSELIQFVFVGIAISCGLFSRKNNESEENHRKMDETNLCLSNLLNVSSFFDDETGNQLVYNENSTLEMWKSQYLKGNNTLVVFEKQLSPTFEITKKAPILSTSIDKSRNREFDEIDLFDFEATVEGNSFMHSPTQCNTKLDIFKTETKSETNASNSFSYESKPHDLFRKRIGRSIKEANWEKSVTTIQKYESVSKGLGKGGLVEEKRTDLDHLVSKRKTCLQTFDFRDYENAINQKNESSEGRDVDKKAGEFIAKFREQIRLQKTESFRR